MMNKNIFSVLTFLVFFGCGQLAVAPQPQERVDIAQAKDKASGFNLTGEQKVEHFSMGSMVLFHDTVAPADVATLVEKTKVRNEALVERIKFQWEHIVEPYYGTFIKERKSLQRESSGTQQLRGTIAHRRNLLSFATVINTVTVVK